ncbi:MAG: PaaI family thioesterase [Thermoplasmata archaeon]
MDEQYLKLKEVIELDPYVKFMGIKVMDIKQGYALVEMDFRKELTRIGNFINGGAIATLADVAGGTAVISYSDVVNDVTVNLNIDYLETIRNGPVTAEGRVIRKGRTMFFCDINVYDGNKKLCTHATGVWYVVNMNKNFK